MATISSSRRKCKLDPNIFCYICGSFTLSKQRQGITDFVKKAYLAYFGVKVGDEKQVCETKLNQSYSCTRWYLIS